jgi:hypothetical protein
VFALPLRDWNHKPGGERTERFQYDQKLQEKQEAFTEPSEIEPSNY